MSASIGTASLILSANAERLQSGLDAAYSKLSSWKNKVSSDVAKLNVGGLLGNLGLGKIAAPLALATGGFKLFGDAVASVKDLSAIGRQAQTLGVSSEAFMGLGAAAKKSGLELPEFGNLLGKMSAKIAAGGTQTADALGQIGLSVGQLQGMNAADQFYAIAGGISRAEGSGVQAAAAMKLFEEAGLRLLPTLQQGEGKLRAFVAAQRASGAALSDGEMATVQKANAAIPKVEALFTGLWNKVVVAMAPVIETIGTAAGQLITFLAPAFGWVGRAVEGYMAVAAPMVEFLLDGISDIVSAIAEWVEASLGLAGEWPGIADVIGGALRVIGLGGAYTFDALKAGAGGVSVALSLLVDGFALVVRGLKNLIGIAAELPEDLGGAFFKDAYARVEGFQADVEAKAKEMRDWGLKQINGFGDTAAKLDAKLNEYKNRAKVADKELAAAGGFAKLDEDKVKGGHVKGDEKNGAIIRGSLEDYSLNAKIATDNLLKTQGERQLGVLGEIKSGIGKLVDLFENLRPLGTI
ncbi:phage tail tape measure protein [Limnoglobus roseus]|uniref:Phage tail tape measure protein n=1 Tax=Limnoglobus roseus TaxID=2598579 RepID=A0A5C1A4L0_9BACT|nr:hypothetical protein [Limnoglobus roseus]QEL14051.1 phage tail tape measure protein [Limnoglobus roseus]